MKVWLPMMQKRPLELLPPTLSLASLLILSWWKWFLHSTTRSEKRHRSIHRQGLWLSHPTAAAGAGLMHRDGSRQELCPLHQPFVVSLGHHRDGRFQLDQHSSAEKLRTKWILPGLKGSLLLWMALKCPEVTPTHLHPPDLGFSWLREAHTGSFPKHQSRGTAMGKGLQTEPAQGCTAPHSSFERTELWGWPMSQCGITQ